MLKNGYRFLPLLPKVIVNLLWAYIQHNKNNFLCQIVYFYLFLQRGCRAFTVLLAYKNRTPDVTLWKLNTANVRHTQIMKIKESTVYRTHEKAQ